MAGRLACKDSIDAEMLERMARVARGFPGCTVSLDADEVQPVNDAGVDPGADDGPISQPVLRVDGVIIEDLLARLSG
jgi:hypothetical protein